MSPLTLPQRIAKRTLDVSVALVGLAVTWWLILIAAAAAAIDTRQPGFFRQERVGLHGRIFRIVKLRTMRDAVGPATSVTTSRDPRVTKLGRLLRRSKLDELPQLWNVLVGHMSLVGPRPDVPGFADRLEGRDRVVLAVRPGITGPATLAFRNEEELLARQEDPERYNREVLFPEKVRINRRYVENYGFVRDLGYLLETVFARAEK